MYDVEDWNNYLIRAFIPLDILLILFIIIGVTGNVLVIYVYGFKMKNINDGQYFIPYLAVADLLGSVICPLFGLSMTLMPLTYEYDALCKLGWVFGSVTTLMSIFLLVTIAIQRYLKICRRKGPRMTLRWKKILMMCALLFSAVIGGTSVFTKGSIPFHHLNRNVTGQICGTKAGTLSVVYDGVLGVGAIICCGLIIVPYCLIARKTHKYLIKKTQCELQKQTDTRNKITENQTKEHSISTPEQSDLEVKASKLKTHENQTIRYSISTLDTEMQSENDITLQDNEELSNNIALDRENSSMRNNRNNINEQPHKLRQTNRRIISQVTKIFMIISFIFIICYIPKIIIIILETASTTFWENATDFERLVLMFVHQGYILNNIANPLIYTFFDEKFKTEIKNIFCHSIFSKTIESN
ncbi:unnamed protein product [Mytilus edulis]|uniref:G-protein coupled receptors family 1 profile domain-containing protein n=1 Tax=Mytilus edulis TaxID=6550 RepID=A0A8S3RQU9_MYTED|nr:unnamed protein product [Mytilus edulis]